MNSTVNHDSMNVHDKGPMKIEMYFTIADFKRRGFSLNAIFFWKVLHPAEKAQSLIAKS